MDQRQCCKIYLYPIYIASIALYNFTLILYRSSFEYNLQYFEKASIDKFSMDKHNESTGCNMIGFV